MGKVGVGVIGCGSIAHKAHLPWYWENKNVELVAVCSDIEEEARNTAARWNAGKWYTDYKKLLQDKDVQAVSICTPVWLHRNMVVEAAEAGKHIICEKPLARNLEEAEAMVSAAKKTGVKFMVGFMKRFNLGFRKIKQLIDDGCIGDVYHCDVHWNLYFPPGSHPSRIFSEDTRIGGGVILDNCSHYIDLFRWLVNSGVDSVYAETSKVVPDRIYEDQAILILRFKNNATSILDMGFNRVEWVEKSAWDSNGKYSLHFTETGFIYGTKGTIVFEAPPFDSVEALKIKAYIQKGEHAMFTGWHEIEVPVSRQPGGPLSPGEVVSYQFKAEIDHFIDCIMNNRELLVSGEDGKIVVEISDYAYKSARTGKKWTIGDCETYS